MPTSEIDYTNNKIDRIVPTDAIIGNPPYQLVNQGAGNGADPLYHLFIDLAIRLGEKSTLIHPARFLFNAGKTPKEWNSSILNNPKFKVVKYWANSTDVFPSVDIKGGVAVTYHDKKANFGSIGFFSAYEELRTILSKVKAKGESAISSIVAPRELYRLTDTLYQENPEMEGRQSSGHKYSLGANIFDIFPELFSDTCIGDEAEMMEIYGRYDNRRCFKWIKRSYITQPDNFEKYKVVITKANGSGALGEVLSTPIVGVPIVGYTDTFIGIGVFDTEAEANACLKYIKTRFARTMLGTLKITQDNTRETWANVPIQDFTSRSDINWDVPVSDIDKLLYTKYQLSDEEIQFIEQNIKPMF
ncbi:Eco57I restriction-modification methylase domain-containing protein [Bacteroides cellulosilyticus]|uniref:Eco57I restriction-modification methylase domain-containing protein n=1 Tax=Bacteroides cellulosilyticus TaxID=246787 RepID=UPI002F961910